MSGEEDVTIFVTRASGSQIASKVGGYFTLRGEKIKFRAIAFGRIGGHNVNVKLTKKDEERIRKMGLDPEEVIIKVQRMMVEGDMVLPPDLKPDQ
ncbi:MAG: hypothetical protein ACE5JV_03170 [Nitrososphaerales archaeon]